MIDKNAVVRSNSVLSRFVCMVRFEKVYSSYNSYFLKKGYSQSFFRENLSHTIVRKA